MIIRLVRGCLRYEIQKHVRDQLLVTVGKFSWKSPQVFLESFDHSRGFAGQATTHPLSQLNDKLVAQSAIDNLLRFWNTIQTRWNPKAFLKEKILIDKYQYGWFSTLSVELVASGEGPVYLKMQMYFSTGIFWYIFIQIHCMRTQNKAPLSLTPPCSVPASLTPLSSAHCKHPPGSWSLGRLCL